MRSPILALTLGMVTFGLVMAVPPPIAAQERGRPGTSSPPPPAGERGGGSGQGTAVPRGGSSGGSSSMGAPTGSSGGGTGGGGVTSGGSSAGFRSGSGIEAARGARRATGSEVVGQAVPPESRPRGARPATGEAVPRGSVSGSGSTIVIRPNSWYPGYYSSYYGGYSGGYYGNYYGNYYGCYPGSWGCDLGLGWGWGSGLGSLYYSPYWGGWGGGYDTSGYVGGYAAGAGSSQSYYTGNLKLKVRPKTAEVYVDGYYVGIVDDFDGAFQELSLTADPNAGMTHRVEIRAPGIQPVTFEVRLQPGQTITYRGDLVAGVQPIR